MSTEKRSARARTTRATSVTATPIPHRARRAGHPAPQASFEQVAAQVLGEIQHALADLFSAAPTGIRKIADVEKAFGVNHLLAWQLYRIVHAHNPLGAGIHVPADVSIKKLLTAAARRKVPAAITERVSDAFKAFEQLAEAEAGDRDELEAMLNAFLPEERRKQDLAGRQAAFKAMSQIRGLAIEAAVATVIYRPSPDGRNIDRAVLNGDFGVRRVRPDARIVISSYDHSRPDNPVLTLDGTPINGPQAALLPEFSTNPSPRFEIQEREGTIDYHVAGDDVGMRSAVDLVMADRRSLPATIVRAPGTRAFRGAGNTIGIPTKRATLDFFLHKDLWPNIPPQLLVYSVAQRGLVARLGDPGREPDRLTTHDEIRLLPPNLAAARLSHIPRYIELLEYTFGKLEWDPAGFRGYRLDVQFPIYASHYCIAFEVPPAPTGA
ncbi:MAG: hypothetical protein ACREJO_03365 [Phycisphaerales bacterium]